MIREATVRDRPGDAAAALPPVDREIARSFSIRVAEDNRLAFARSFGLAIVEAYWRARSTRLRFSPLPQTIEQLQLSADAALAAERFGNSIASLDPSTATYLLGTVYATALPEAYRGTHGIFYTPPALVERLLAMAEDAGVDWRTARAFDPACGCGAFLVPIARRMIAALGETEPEFVLQQLGARLRGVDIDPFGAWLAQVMLEIALDDLVRAAGRPVPKMIETRDSLELRESDVGSYDLIVGNPPYGRVSLLPARRAAFARSVYGHANLYGLFTDAALHWVKRGGVIGYVTPTSMLSGLYYKALRRLLSDKAPPHEINFVSERGGVFHDVLQETMLATYRRASKERMGKVGFVAVATNGRGTFRQGGTFTLPANSESPWLLPRSAEQTGLIRRLQAMPHRLSDYGYGVSTGPLVWNRFKGQFRAKPESGSYPVVWAESVTSDGRFIWRSEKRNHMPWFAADRPKDDWLIVDRPCVLLQRTTAKEQPRRLIAAELSHDFVCKHRGVVVENHLNMIRAKASKPKLATAVIAVLLNSVAIDKAFRCLNGSVAVSAFELEELPLPSPAVLARVGKLVASGRMAEVEAVLAAAYGEA